MLMAWGALIESETQSIFVVPVKIYFRPLQESEFGPLANISSYRDRKIDLTAHFGFSSDDTRDTVVRSETGEDLFWPSNFLPCKSSLFGKKKNCFDWLLSS